MRKLNDLKTDSLRKIEPPVQLVEPETVPPVLAPYVHELHRRPLASDIRIERRGEQRGVDRIDAVAGRRLHERLDQRPMPLRKDVDAVIGGDAVRMKPFRMQQPLFRQPCGQHVERERLGGGRRSVLGDEADFDRILARFVASVKLDRHPDGAPLARRSNPAFLRLGRQQRVRVKSRFRTHDIVVVVGIYGHLRRDEANRAQRYGRLKCRGGFDLHSLQQKAAAVSDLERECFVAKSGRLAERGCRQLFIGKNFLERTDHARFQCNGHMPITP
nr:hypothetical protein [Paenibacillus cisolokensis]